ncbi:hypothetical protein, partial [Ferrovibrio sp.]|uniref:hypothetical protein n=1 Tax=Ferrovibrio sp. TaxID=1917215 RepID=UPI0039C86EF4
HAARKVGIAAKSSKRGTGRKPQPISERGATNTESSKRGTGRKPQPAGSESGGEHQSSKRGTGRKPQLFPLLVKATMPWC